jgi:hypothetical protein
MSVDWTAFRILHAKQPERRSTCEKQQLEGRSAAFPHLHPWIRPVASMEQGALPLVPPYSTPCGFASPIQLFFFEYVNIKASEYIQSQKIQA